MQDLQHQLERLTQVSRTPSEVEEAIREIAVTVLRQVKIVAGNRNYTIREFEMYYFNRAIHPDDYCHCRPRQLEFGLWYFHRYGRDPQAFLRNPRNGVDLTFGNKKKGIYGGLLIRAIQAVGETVTIDGINKVMRELVSGFTTDGLHELATSEQANAFDPACCLHLETFGHAYDQPIRELPRVGLPTPQNAQAEKFYRSKYRYQIGFH
jgi:hypothetical protein